MFLFIATIKTKGRPAAKTAEILKTPQQKGFYFFISKNPILTGKKQCGESRRCRNASAGPEIYKWPSSCLSGEIDGVKNHLSEYYQSIHLDHKHQEAFQ